MDRMSRRDLICSLGMALPWIALEASAARGSVAASPGPPRGPRGILALELLAADLAPLVPFYRDVLGFAALESGAESCSFAAGGTRLTFRRAAAGIARPTYHVAFNVPQNKLASARSWLAARLPLVARDGEEVFHFPTWNSHSVYFLDPAGNLLELIARHNLPNGAPGAFAPREILYASEIGLVVDDVPAEVARLGATLGLPVYRPGSATFVPVGDEHRMLIVVERDRVWFPTVDRPAHVFPLTAVLASERAAAWNPARFPFAVRLAPAL